jgi:hypothetical protein
VRGQAIADTKQQNRFPLKWIPDSTVFSEVGFKGYETGNAASEATGLQKMYYDHSKPFTKQIRYFHSFRPGSEIRTPRAYLIPQGWQDLINLLEVNKVSYSRLKKDTLISVTAYKIADYKSSPKAYEKHHRNYGVKVDSLFTQVKFLKGDVLVYLNQPANRYLVEMLEPTGDDSFFAWNFFDGILQQKEGYSDYRWEDIAAGVLKNDPSLREKLEAKKASDSKFAGDSEAILDYIYKNSAYYEKAHLQYPVYRIEY